MEIPGIERAVAIALGDDDVTYAVTKDGHILTTSVQDLTQLEPARSVGVMKGAVKIVPDGRDRGYVLSNDRRIMRFGIFDQHRERMPDLNENVVALSRSYVVFATGRVDRFTYLRGFTKTDIDDAVGIVGPYVLRADGSLVSWESPLGGPPETETTLPPKTSGFASSDSLFDVSTACVLAERNVLCAGGSRVGERGAGAAPARTAFSKVALPAPAIQVAAGRRSFCAVLDQGDLWCWGSNDGGQLGDGTLRDREAPIRVDHATSPAPPPRVDGFDQAQEGPPFDWSTLPATCNRPNDMIIGYGIPWVAPVVSAYVYRDEQRTSITFANFALDPRGYSSGNFLEPPFLPTRGNQKAVIIELVRGTEQKPRAADRGIYSWRSTDRRAKMRVFLRNTENGWLPEKESDLRVEVTHYDAAWLCGSLTFNSPGNAPVARSFAARVAPADS